MSDLHPDFLAASPRAQWTGTLPDLWAELKVEAWQRRGQWAHRILPRGALVALRILPHDQMRRELRLARRGAGTPEGWAQETRTFLGAFRCSDWFPEVVTPSEGMQESRWVERYPGETERGQARCDMCGAPVAHSILWGAARCDSCARTAGAAEAAAHRRP